MNQQQANDTTYDDPELYYSEENEPPSPDLIYAYPLKTCGACAFSLVSNSFQEFMQENNPQISGAQTYNGEFSVSPVSLGVLPEMIHMRDTTASFGSIDTEQIRRFWEIYNDYPRYLRAVKKRSRKKNKKKVANEGGCSLK